MTTKPLDDKRLGLLFRMMGLRSVVCTKAIINPLVVRAFAAKNQHCGYEITKRGREHVTAELKRLPKKGRVVESYEMVAIGNIVGIVKTPRREASHDH